MKTIQIQSQIKRLFEEDQNDRIQLRKKNYSSKKLWTILKKNDERRRNAVNKILSNKIIAYR